jgi:hypothetical protein
VSRAEPERELTMRRKVILVTVMMALVRVVIASASPVVDAVLVALAILLLVTVWDKFAIEDTGRGADPARPHELTASARDERVQ